MTNNIPFSLALRIVRICSEEHSRDQRLSELRQMLIDRDYKPGIIDAAITRAKSIPRSEALKKVVKSINLSTECDNLKKEFMITHIGTLSKF